MYGLQMETERKVVIYARVSTEHEAQLYALDNQISWYESYLEAHPEWSVVDRYIDEGITGTSAKKRPEFMRMMEDAKRHKFDLIITREVSRFARNTVDTLQYTRMLRSKGVEVFFINDNIKTFDSDGELRLTIMATLAQDESRKTSIRVKAGQQISMEKGVYYGNGNILGYDRVGKEYVINLEQAKTVRLIYEMYLSGMGLTRIGFELEQRGRLTAMGKTRWYATTIAHVLGNPFYCGIMQYHKQYTPDYLEQKKVDNYGEIEFVYVQGTHEPIVSIDEFRRVQWILDQRREERRSMDGSKTVKMKGKSMPQTVWGRLLICHCGLRFHRTSYHRKLPAYICYNVSKFGSIAQREKKGLSIAEACDSPYLPQWRLEMIAQRIFKEYICDTDKIVDLAMEMIKKHMAAADGRMNALQQTLNQYIKEEKAIGKKLDVFISMRTEGEITKVEFYERTKDLQERMTRLGHEIKGITDELQTLKNVDYAERLAYLRRKLNSYVDFSESTVISDSVVEAFIKKIVVFCDHQDWYLRTEDDTWSLFGGKSFAPDQIFDEKLLVDANSGMWVDTFTVTYDDAKQYVKQIDPKRCVKKWNEIKVNLYI